MHILEPLVLQDIPILLDLKPLQIGGKGVVLIHRSELVGETGVFVPPLEKELVICSIAQMLTTCVRGIHIRLVVQRSSFLCQQIVLSQTSRLIKVRLL